MSISFNNNRFVSPSAIRFGGSTNKESEIKILTTIEQIKSEVPDLSKETLDALPKLLQGWCINRELRYRLVPSATAKYQAEIGIKGFQGEPLVAQVDVKKPDAHPMLEAHFSPLWVTGDSLKQVIEALVEKAQNRKIVG